MKEVVFPRKLNISTIVTYFYRWNHLYYLLLIPAFLRYVNLDRGGFERSVFAHNFPLEDINNYVI